MTERIEKEERKEYLSLNKQQRQQQHYPQVGELRRRRIHPNEESSTRPSAQSSQVNVTEGPPLTSVVELSVQSSVTSLHLEHKMQEIQDIKLPSLPQHSSITHSLPPTIISSPAPCTGLEETKIQYQQHQQQPPLQHKAYISTSSLYTYSSDSYTGRVLAYLSNIFLRKRRDSNNIDNSPPNHPTTHSTNQDKIHYEIDRTRSGSAFAGFLSLLMVTCANYMLSPMRDAAALAVGVSHIPLLTFVSTVLALGSSVPVGWLFEAPNPERRGKSWRDKIGLTRGETQGTSLALFYRCFAICLIGYAFTFKVFEILGAWSAVLDEDGDKDTVDTIEEVQSLFPTSWDYDELTSWAYHIAATILKKFGKAFYVAFFLVVHLMKLHSLSLIWGVTSEAMEYEEQAELREKRRRRRYEMENDIHCSYLYRGNTRKEELRNNDTTETEPAAKDSSSGKKSKLSSVRVKRLAFVGFGGTLGGIIGSVFVSITAHTLRLSGLLTVSAILLELSAQLSVELGQIMLRHWQEEQLERSSDDDLVILGKSHSSDRTEQSEGDSSMKRIASAGSMKRVASGHNFQNFNQNSNESGVDSSLKKVSSLGSMKRVASGNSIGHLSRAKSSGDFRVAENDNSQPSNTPATTTITLTNDQNAKEGEATTVDDNTFKQRLLRGITTILRSRLLMTIFTYNALYATTSVLLSFQRAELVANRNTTTDNSVASDTAFLARINMASSVGVFVLQASGMGAFIASSCGQRGTLSLMPVVRLLGVAMLALWHVKTGGQPPNLIVFLVLDEFTKVINFAVAKPVREGLWLGLSNEARYEAKPIVDTLANRWGGGSAAFLMSLLNHIMTLTGLGDVAADGNKTLFGFPPILILCSIAAAWWSMVSIDLGNIRHRIDMELKKQE